MEKKCIICNKAFEARGRTITCSIECRLKRSKNIDHKLWNNFKQSDKYQTYIKNKSEYDQQYRQDNKEKIKETQKNWHENNKVHKHNKYNENKEEINRKRRLYLKEKRKEPAFKIKKRVSDSIRKQLKKLDLKKDFPTWMKLSYTPEQLKEHLEKLWEPWMSWDNYGKYKIDDIKRWNIDHIIPQSKLPYFSLEDENFQKCWALENLRPLEALENTAKGNK